VVEKLMAEALGEHISGKLLARKGDDGKKIDES